MQLSPRNKLNLFWDEQNVCRSRARTAATTRTRCPRPKPTATATSIRCARSRRRIPRRSATSILIEGGFGYFFSRWGGRAKENPNTESLVKIVEQCTAGCPANGNIPGLTYRSQTVDLFSDGRNKNITTTWRGSVSFVSGGESLKIGYQGSLLGDIRSANRGPNELRYRVNNGVPNQLTMFINEFQNDLWMRDDALLRAGDSGRMSKLTLQGGLRFDRAWSWAPRAAGRARAFLPVAAHLPGNAGRRQLQGPHAAHGGHLRSVRQRQDRAQGQRRQVSRGDDHGVELRDREPDVAHRAERHAQLDRHQRQLQSPTAIC